MKLKKLITNSMSLKGKLFVLFTAFFLQFNTYLFAQTLAEKNYMRYNTLAGFIENKGQIIDQHNAPNLNVKYLLNMPGLNVQLTRNGFSYDAYIAERHQKEKSQHELPGITEQSDNFTLHFHRVDIEFSGANTSPQMIAENQGSDYLNYYTTSTPEEGITYVRHFGKITYKDLYPGIDLVFMAQPDINKAVEFNFIVHPGADLSALKWKYTGSNGIRLQDGQILIQTIHGMISESIPLAWEEETTKTVEISYEELENGIYTFTGSYDRKNTLIIDPVPDIKWSGYYGGSGNDQAHGASYDSAGNVYVTGETTSSSNIATSGTQQTTYGGGSVQYALGGDAFLIKFSSTGSRIWGTYYGGSAEDVGYSICTNKGGDSYVSGDTKSTSGIATTGAFQTSFAGSYHDVFLAKFNTSGIRQWGTYYGGTGNDRSYYNSMAMDASGNVYITGVNNTANNSWITTAGCYQSTNGSTSAYDAPFASKWSPSGTLIWGTYYGGGGSFHNQAYAIAVDNSGNVYLTGSCTSTSGFASSGAYQSSYGGGSYDAYVVKLNNTGTARIWGTYYGNSGTDVARGIAVDHSGNVYIAGYTSSTSGFTTSGAHQSTYAGGTYDGFLAKFNSTGSRVWGSYYGGAGSDVFSKLTYTSNGDLILTGYIDTTSSSAALPTTGAFQTTYKGGTHEGIVAKFNTSGARLWCSYYGGELQDLIYNNVVDDRGNIYITGRTLSTTGLATSGVHQTSYAGGTMDGFVAKILDQPTLLASASTIQPDTTSTPAGTNNKMIIGIKITTTGYNPFAKVTQFSFDTAGVFNYSNITGTAKVYYTGNSSTFSTNKLFDSTSAKPTSAFTVSGSQVLDTGIVYFWLTFDVNFNATVNNYLDAKCTEIKWDSGGTTVSRKPLIISAVGKIRITAPLKKLGSISFTQPSTYYLYRYSTDNPVLRVDLNVIGTADTLKLEQLTVNAVNTDNADVSYVKLYFTTTSTFSNSTLVGTATSLSGGKAVFSSLNHSLPSGTSYVWVTYDIPGSATLFDTVDAKIPVSGLVIGGKSYPSSEQNPTGNRIIYPSFQYDAGISSILSPAAPYCKTTQDIKVRLYNYGTSTLSSDTIRWTVNGVAQTPYIWTGSLLTGISTDLTIGSYSFTIGTPYTIKVFPSFVNGMYVDAYPLNDTATKTFTFYPVPVANFSVNDSFQCFKGNSFLFTNTSTIGSGTFTSYWDFGDTTYSSSASPTHSYQNLNSFPVMLIATSAYGCSDTFIKSVALKPNQTTAFTLSDTARCFNGNTFSFTNTSTFSYGSFTNTWNFGDNSTSTATSPSHSYSTADTYQVKLITTTNTGCIDSLIKTIYVYPHPFSQFNTDTSQCKNTNLFWFLNSTTISSGTFTNLWNFGDNTSSTYLDPTKSYSSTGVYSVKLITTSDKGCSDSISHAVIVHPNPLTSFTLNDSSQCTNTNSFVFSNNSSISSGTFSNLWHFGDMTTSTNVSPTKKYSNSGIFTVKMVTTSDMGCKDSTTRKVYVRPNTGAYFTISDSDQCFNQNSFTFYNLSNIISGTFSNFWTFGDNTNSTIKTPSKSYLTTGTYTVKLLTTSDYGCKDSFIRSAYVRPHPLTSFSINDSAQCVKLNSFVFTNSTSIASGTFTSLWTFGDTKTSTLASPVYSYNDPGNFTVRVTTTSDNGCTDFSERKVIVHPRPFTYFTTSMSPQCLRSNLFVFDNRSSVNPGKITNSYWQFGDGDSSELSKPQHKYMSVGKFTVLLKVVTDAGCMDTSSKQVEVIPQPQAGMIISDTALCFKDNLFQFTDDSKTNTGTITDFFWDFGDDKFSTLKNTNHAYTISRSYLVSHIVTSSNGCTDTATKTIVVHPMPVAVFTVNDSIQCQKGNSYVLTNKSTPSGGLNYNWNFGDGETSADASPSYSYANFGAYVIRLISVTTANCPDTFERGIYVKKSPVVNLGKDTTLYHNQSITLDAGGVYDSYLWSNSKTTQTIVVDTNDIGLNNPTLFWVNVDLDGCEETDSVNITFIHNVSINDQGKVLNIVVYPNPASDFINIGSDRVMENLTISLRDMNGKILILEPLHNKSQHQLDLREFAKGVYFLNLTTDDATRTVKVIKY